MPGRQAARYATGPNLLITRTRHEQSYAHIYLPKMAFYKYVYTSSVYLSSDHILAARLNIENHINNKTHLKLKSKSIAHISIHVECLNGFRFNFNLGFDI